MRNRSRYSANLEVVTRKNRKKARYGSRHNSKMFKEACQTLNVKHVLTKTLQREWAYARTYDSSEQRDMFLEPFLHLYN